MKPNVCWSWSPYLSSLPLTLWWFWCWVKFLDSYEIFIWLTLVILWVFQWCFEISIQQMDGFGTFDTDLLSTARSISLFAQNVGGVFWEIWSASYRRYYVCRRLILFWNGWELQVYYLSQYSAHHKTPEHLSKCKADKTERHLLQSQTMSWLNTHHTSQLLKTKPIVWYWGLQQT